MKTTILLRSLLIILCGFVALIACGNPDRSTSSPPHLGPQTNPTILTGQSGATITPTWDTSYLLTPVTETPRDDVATEIALKAVAEQTEESRQATSMALPTLTPIDVLPTFPPQPTIALNYGIIGCSSDKYKTIQFYTTDICWAKKINADTQIVVETGGSSKDNIAIQQHTNQGGLRVLTYTPILTSDPQKSPIYWTPTNTGDLTIQSVHEPLMYLISSGGRTFIFNLETRRWITPVTLVVANPAALSESDQALQTFLAGRDYLPMLRTPSSITSTTVLTSHVVLLSSSVSASVAQSQFKNAPHPVIAWNPAVYPALKLTTSAGVDSADQLVIEQAEHPLAAGLRDRVILYDKAVDMPYGVPSANAITVGYALVNERGVPPRSSYFAYDKGTMMADGVVAPARRVAIPWSSDGTPSDEAWKLLDYAIQWAGMP